MQQKNRMIYLLTTLFLLTGCSGENPSSSENVPKKKTSDINRKATLKKDYQEDTSKNKKIIDLLILTDKNDKNSLNGTNETKIDHFIAVTNSIFNNSTLNAKFHIKKIQPYTFYHQKSSDALYDTYSDKNITKLRDKVKADLVITYRNNKGMGNCGVAYLNDVLDKEVGYAHILLECPSTTTAHEIGHTMGLTHSPQQAKEKGLFPYGRGYGIEDEFITIMAYRSIYHTNVRMFNYSSPNFECNGYDCGVDAELENSADSVKALRYAIDHVSNFK